MWNVEEGDHSDPPGGGRLHEALEQLVSLQRDGVQPEDALRELIHSAASSVPGSQYAGITLVDDAGKITSVAATHDYAIVLDEIQSQVTEGPCLSATWENHTILVNDLEADDRWPQYRTAVLERTPVRAIASFQLHTEGRSLAALNFYAEAPNAFASDAVEMGLIYAAHTTVAWNSVRREQQFRTALSNRDVIGQAKGMLMERFNVDAVAAFELLRRLSQDANVKLAQVAERVVAEGSDRS